MGFWSSFKEKAKSVGHKLKETWQDVKKAGREIIEEIQKRTDTWSERAEQFSNKVKQKIIDTCNNVKTKIKEKIKEHEIRSKHPGYVPTKPDQKAATECKEFLDSKFSRGIRETMSDQNPQERIQTIKEVVKEASQILDVEVDKVEFYESEGEMAKTCGYFDRTENSLNLNAYMITCDNMRLVEEQVYTVFHELIHARQWAAVKGKNYGYPSETVLEWAYNFENGNYVLPEVDDELYRKQPLERDAFGFEALIKGKYTIEEFIKYNSK